MPRTFGAAGRTAGGFPSHHRLIGYRSPRTPQTLDQANDESAQIRRAQDGDTAAFEALFRAHYPRVYRTVHGLLGNDADARDAAQQTWVKVWRNLGAYDHSAAFTTWLHRIAVNTALDELRKRKRLRARFQSLFAGPGRDETAPPPPDPPAEGDPARDLVDAERAARVHRAIAELPEAQRTVLVLKEFEGYTYRRIADTLGIRIGTVMSRLHLARKKLQTLLDKG
jgi:RNA polymerase sigma-70 factor (ECF subfamily)